MGTTQAAINNNLSLIFEGDTPIEWTLQSRAGLLYQGWIVTGFCFLVLTSLLRKYKASKLVILGFLMPILSAFREGPEFRFVSGNWVSRNRDLSRK